MDHVLGHLVRRGMEAHASFPTASEPTPDEPSFKMPIWGVALLASTSIFFFLILGMVNAQHRATRPPITANNFPD
jgi:hypothetical protein